MREISKLSVFLIGVGMILCVIIITPRKRNIFVVVSQKDMDKSLGRESRNISKTGAWQNTKFTHLIDDKFGASLVSILKENDIDSITDLGCGTGAYVKMIEDNNIRTQGKRREVNKLFTLKLCLYILTHYSHYLHF